MSVPPPETVDRLLREALAEDLGTAGDRTTDLLIPVDAVATGSVRAEERLVAAGATLGARVFELLNPGVRILAASPDGAGLGPGELLLRVSGPARALLTGERTALNLLGRLCGIATLARRAVEAVAGTPSRIYDTRKTTPGLRLLEKYAVRCGGAENHRIGLHDMALIKENHIALAGGVGEAVRRVRAGLPPDVPLEVEVTSLAGMEEAIDAGAELILLDNMDRATMRKAVARAGERARLEASGGISPEEAGEIARQTGVHRISMGSLTRAAPWSDVSMDIEAGVR